MKINKLIIAALLVASSFASLTAQKFGYVNVQEIFMALPETKEANSEIETFTNQIQKRAEQMVTALQKKYQDIQRKQESGEISPKQLEIEAQSLKEEEAEIQKFELTSQQQILKKQEDLIAPIRDKIQTAINAVASENGYTYIFDNSSGVILFADQSTDVGALVKAKLNIK